MRRRLLLGIVTVVVLAVAWTAYRNFIGRAFVVHGVLPAPPPGELKFAGEIPNNPFRVESGNTLARTVFQTSGPSNSRIEVREFLILPQEETNLGAQTGPMLVQVESGAGTVSINNKLEELAASTVRAISAGQATSFRNVGARPLALRVYRFGVE